MSSDKVLEVVPGAGFPSYAVLRSWFGSDFWRIAVGFKLLDLLALLGFLKEANERVNKLSLTGFREVFLDQDRNFGIFEEHTEKMVIYCEEIDGLWQVCCDSEETLKIMAELHEEKVLSQKKNKAENKVICKIVEPGEGSECPNRTELVMNLGSAVFGVELMQSKRRKEF